ncbi:hypothetical protein, partial [Pseudomonas savastanoi]|uniref:hypothetical protein n=1 Tax=Pseudomonas savastanoi TaxID=29438 RepID=UPI001C8160BC
RFDFLDHCPFLSKSEPNTQNALPNTDPTHLKPFKNNELIKSVLGVLGLSGLSVLAWRKNNCALSGINNVTHARTRSQTQHTQHTRLHPAKDGRLICVGLPKPTQNIPNTPDTL